MIAMLRGVLRPSGASWPAFDKTQTIEDMQPCSDKLVDWFWWFWGVLPSQRLLSHNRYRDRLFRVRPGSL